MRVPAPRVWRGATSLAVSGLLLAATFSVRASATRAGEHTDLAHVARPDGSVWVLRSVAGSLEPSALRAPVGRGRRRGGPTRERVFVLEAHGPLWAGRPRRHADEAHHRPEDAGLRRRPLSGAHARGQRAGLGRQRSGQLGDGSWQDREEPAPVNGLEGAFVAVAAGGSHSLALGGTGACGPGAPTIGASSGSAAAAARWWSRCRWA
jgi:hypothetical protein